MTVELLYDQHCPNVAEARANLRHAFVEAGLPARWTERELSAPDVASPLRGFGSPTVLVDGRDVAGAEPGDAACCRVYEASGRRTGAPPAELIARALKAVEPPRPGRWRVGLVLPAMGAALVPGLACPACWPSYAALLSALGLPFIPTATHLFPITIGVLLVAVAALSLRAESIVPVVVGLVASLMIVVGKFVVDSNAINYTGAALLVAASLLELRRRGKEATCPACVPDESARCGGVPTPSTEGR